MSFLLFFTVCLNLMQYSMTSPAYRANDKRNVNQYEEALAKYDQETLYNFLQTLINTKLYLSQNDARRSRRSNPGLRNMYKYLLGSVSGNKLMLRNYAVLPGHENDYLRAAVPELVPSQNDVDEAKAEIQEIEAHKVSALHDKPFVEKQGLNDFLVMGHEIDDNLKSYVPNDIYYNVEKNCANWLDECNSQGIRDYLLRKVEVFE